MSRARAALRRVLSWWLALPGPIRLAAPVAVMVVLWFLSASPPSRREPSVLRALLYNGAHVVAYFGLGGAWLLALSAGRGAVSPVAARWSVLLSVVYGVVDELHQSFVPGRHCSVWDALCDACGSAIAALLVCWIFTGERRHAVRAGWILVVAIASVAAATFLPG